MQSHKNEISSSSLTNHDLVPTTAEQRTWKTANFVSMWVGALNNIPTYVTIGGLVVLGFSPLQVIGIVLVASLILYAALTLNGHTGSKFGIPFPVIARTSYGIRGANIPALLRGFVAIMWLGIQTFAGSTALRIAISSMWPGWDSFGGGSKILGIDLPGLLSFLIFWSLHLLVLKSGMESLKKFQKWTGPIVGIVIIAMLIWALKTAGGMSAIYSLPSKYDTFGKAFFPFLAAVTGVIGYWATLILNVPDFTRFARSQKDQIKGQLIGLPVIFTVFTFATVTIVGATAVAYHTPLSDPVETLRHFNSPFLIAISAFLLSSATVTVNVIANMVSPAYDLANLFPKYIDFKRGFYITAFLALFTFPWELMKNADSIFTMLNMIGGFLGPVAGVMIAHYFNIKKREINMKDLYTYRGEYMYYKGYNYRAFLATVVGAVLALIGQFVPAMKNVYEVSWFVGVITAYILYIVLMRVHPPATVTMPAHVEEERTHA
ncbi:NCS1 family nucleobase:cation symporter-1 [Peribacillus kribbensis]|uniref:NCS1 family nucleobase:cation symporter-1 n=1 Tax=Peribacillus kribbensis TaxID=356658 RepID=UPI0004179A2A|nr:NCS1 family nucleobase:cation symporter-1 [Peribacillus kribbensis]